MSEEKNLEAQHEIPEQDTCTGQDCQNVADMSVEADISAASETPTEVSLEDQLAQLQDNHLRLMAEYDNYRKRTLKEKSDLIRNGGEKVLKDLLPVVDDLELALANMAATEDVVALREGIQLIYSKFVDYLTRQGIKSIEAKDVPFNEELHEAIATFPAPAPEQKGQVIDCVKRGYTLHDKVIRYASVVVGQ